MAENEKFGRQPHLEVQVDQDFCTRTYGVLPCQASLSENLLLWTSDYSNPYWIYQDSSRAAEYLDPDGIRMVDVTITPTQGDIRTTGAGTNLGLIGQGVRYGCRMRIRRKPDDSKSFFFVFVILVSSDGEPDQGGQIILQVASNTGTIQGDSSTATAGTFAIWDLQYSVTVDGDYLEFDGYLTANHASGVVDSALFQVISAYRNETGDGDNTFSTGELTVFTASDGDEFTGHVETDDQIRVRTGLDKCFNTRATCQDPTNYDKGVQVLRFVQNQAELPKDAYYIPSLKSAKVGPSRLNPGGANKNASAFGQRATLTVTLQDHTHDDRIVDLYRAEREYDPRERGTFWSKWRARNPYYMQRPIRLVSGYLVDGEVVDAVTREFVVTGFEGPNAAGVVTLKGKDVLALVENDKAQAPKASEGKLAADITAGAGSAVLSPAGIGSTYPASGEARIGREVVTFTRSGDNLTLTGRGTFGTDADGHDEGDLVQICLRYTAQSPQDILEDLLLNYGNLPAQYIPKAAWDSEALDYLPRKYSTLITEPVGVAALIGEMCQQMYFTIWWDERTGLIKLRAVRLAQDDLVYELNDNEHLLADSIQWRDLSDELITQVWVYYGQIDPTDELEKGRNYSALAITADPLAEGADRHNLRRVKTIFSRWIDATNAGAAEDLGARILNRYGNAPREITFSVDAKDNYIWLGDYLRVSNRLRVDPLGNPQEVNLQVFQAEEQELGTKFRFTAQEFIPALIGGDVEDPATRTIPLTSDLLNVNLRTIHDSQFGAPTGTETVTFVIRAGVKIGGHAAGGGVNVPYAARITANDIYAGGNNIITGFDVGDLVVLQRNSISVARTFTAGQTYPGIGATDVLVKEYPVAISLDTGTWPAGVKLQLVVEAGAYIIGEGANGSAHGTQVLAGASSSVRTSIPGGDGGHAMRIRYPIEITNGGVIGGGGGGGGGYWDATNTTLGIFAGGGAGGFEFSDVKELTGNIADLIFEGYPLRQPAGGGITKGGKGGYSAASGPTVSYEREGGKGGDLAASGGSGRFYFNSSGAITNINSGAGGQPGKAITEGAGLVTWVNKGDVRGAEVV